MQAPKSAQAVPTATLEALAAEIRSWWNTESSDWDKEVAGAGASSFATDLWDGMPVVDSKSVARTSPIFERHLGRRLTVKLIRPGGYGSIDEMIDDLIPKMAGTAAAA